MIRGFVDPEFWEVGQVLRRQVRRAGGGAAVCVYFHGRPVVDTWAGIRDDATGEPWEADTPAISFSTTKGVTATALHVLVDRGQIDVDAPVATYWPEFGRGGKERITVRHVLSHRSGLYHLRHLIDDGERMLDWKHMVRSLERAFPLHPPGAHPGYHGLTFGWLVGELIERVSGTPFSEFIRRELAEPLGLTDLHVGAPADAIRRAAVLPRPNDAVPGPSRFHLLSSAVGFLSRAVGYPVDLRNTRDALLPKKGGDVLWRREALEVPIPAANGLFTARSLARLYAALGAGGEIDGTRILSARTVEQATAVETRQRDRVLVFRPHWRLGYHGIMTTRGGLPRAFGHFGFGGSGAFADPDRGLAVAMTNNRAGGTPLGDLRILEIGAAATTCADRQLRSRDRIHAPGPSPRPRPARTERDDPEPRVVRQGDLHDGS